MSNPSKLVLVSAVVLIGSDNRILLAQRPKDKSMAGLWEFPGGKVHANESPEQALVREAQEELGIGISAENLLPLTFASHAYPEFHLLMPLFTCRIWHGAPHGREGQELAWVTKNEMRGYPMPPADERILPAVLRLI